MSKTKIPARLRADILTRDGYKCLWCNRGRADGVILHIDHVHPECFEGLTTIENLGTLCNECNLSKGGKYYGNYLLSTIFKVPKIWGRLVTVPKIDPGIGTLYRVSLNFYKFDGHGWQEDKLRYEYLIDDILLISKDRGSSTSKIEIREIERKALLEFKDIVKDFLFDNKGFFELLDDQLIFKKFKEN